MFLLVKMIQQHFKGTSILNLRRDNCDTELRDLTIKLLSVISDVSGNTVTMSSEIPGIVTFQLSKF